MGDIITVDPGVHFFAFARFENRVLVDCNFLATKNLFSYKHFFNFNCDMIIEKPQIYEQRLQKGDPNDLINLAIFCGKLEVFLRLTCRKIKKLDYIYPAAWKGQTPKTIMLRRIQKKLSVYEAALVDYLGLPKSKKHNVIDAVGIGLNYYGRI